MENEMYAKSFTLAGTLAAVLILACAGVILNNVQVGKPYNALRCQGIECAL